MTLYAPAQFYITTAAAEFDIHMEDHYCFFSSGSDSTMRSDFMKVTAPTSQI